MRFAVLRSPLSSVLLFLISVYRKVVSPVLPGACRFYPSCSDYATQAIQRHGAGSGSVLAIKRICRCHPLHPGGLDPVPGSKKG